MGLSPLNTSGTESLEKHANDIVEVYRVQPIRPDSDIVLGGAFYRLRKDGKSITQANKERKKLLNKIESPDPEKAVNAMQHAQASGYSSPVISTSFDRKGIEKEFLKGIAKGRNIELITIRGPKKAGIDFNLELQKNGGRTKPNRFRDEEMKEFGIKDLYIPPKGKGKSKSGFEIIDVKRKGK